MELIDTENMLVTARSGEGGAGEMNEGYQKYTFSVKYIIKNKNK